MRHQDPTTNSTQRYPQPIERVDLSRLASQVKRLLRGHRLLGYLRGKTRVRDAVMRLRGASAYRAELLTDQLQARGFLRFVGDPRVLPPARGRWVIEPMPVSAC